MQRLTPLAAIGSIAAVLALVPVLGAVALAADPIVVHSGDTLTAISARHGVPVERIVELNAIADPDRIFVGQRLRLEGDGDTERSATVHVVRRGESLWGIARHYGSTVAAIAAANRIADPSRIFGGQRLAIPGVTAPPAATPPAEAPPAPTAAAPEPIVHVVRRGESLWGIARHYGSTVAAIAAANGIADPSRIFGGQRLAIPGATAPSGAAPSLPADIVSAVAARDDVRRVIVAEARAQGVPAALALAVAWQESGWRQDVVSYAGAVGVMQLLPSTAEWVSMTMLARPVDIGDTRDNVLAGVRLLAHYIERYGASSDLVLAAYYQGQRAADRHGIYAMTWPYITSVRALQRAFGG